jgi:hypothetical protein
MLLSECERPMRPVDSIEEAYVDALRAWALCSEKINALRVFYDKGDE